MLIKLGLATTGTVVTAARSVEMIKMTSKSLWLRFLPTAWRRDLRHLDTLHAVIKNSSWLLGDRLVRTGLSLLIGAWIARHLGPSLYGEFAYVVALAALFQALSSLGLESIVVRNISQASAQAPCILGSAFALRVGAGMLAWISMVATVAGMRPGDSSEMVMVTLLGAGLVLQSSDIVELWFQSRTRSKLAVLAKVLAYVASSSIKVALILLDAPLWSFAAAQSADFAFAAVALTWAYRREPAPDRWQWDRATAWSMVREAWPLMFAGLSVVIYMRIDQLILRELATERELGLYSAIIPFSNIWHLLPVTLCASLLPKFAELRQSDAILYQRRLQQLYSLVAWIGIATTFITAMLATWLVELLLGPTYKDAAPILRWHALSNVFVFLGVAQSIAIISERTPHLSLLKTLSGAIASVALNLALVPHWGAVGAAWSAIGSQFCAAMLTNAIFAPASLSMQLRSFWPFNVRRHR
jgi:O-antigen/teichoic acid export membrane protein